MVFPTDAAVQILSNNNISKLADCDGLSQFTKLEMLSLLDNPVTKEANYRLYVIRKCPALKHLDFRKVRAAARPAGTMPRGIDSLAFPRCPVGERDEQSTKAIEPKAVDSSVLAR